MNPITFSQAIDGYLLHANSRRLSTHAIADYTNTYRKFRAYLAPDDPPLADIEVDDVETFLASQEHLSQKTLLNFHTALSAMWTWAQRRRLVDANILQQIPRPRPEQRVIEIFTEEEVQRILDACNRSQSYQRPGKKKCSHARPTAVRDKTIVLALLDSMVRIHELCAMKISLMNLQQGTIKVMGKGKKERVVPMTSDTADAIWYYISSARPTPRPKYSDILFLTGEGRPLNRNSVGKMIRHFGRRVGVEANPHKFRHTGATQFIRNGGNAFALQRILGHSTMKMVQRYVHLAQVDIEEAHRQASAVYNWDLRI